MSSRMLGLNAVFHDPAAALVIDGVTVAAAEEERFTRRKHGKEPVAFSTWELPERSARWCLEHAGVEPGRLDAVAYSYDPALRASWRLRCPGSIPGASGSCHTTARTRRRRTSRAASSPAPFSPWTAAES